MKGTLILTIVAVVFYGTAGVARTWRIQVNGAGDAPTIQAGIDSAAAGDTVLLANGTYTGIGNRNVRYHGKPVTVRSESGDRTLCVVDCSYGGRGFIFELGDDPGAVLEGITVTKGSRVTLNPPPDSGGAGISCDAASPTIRNVIISNCRADIYGGGMWCFGGAAPVLGGVVFAQNEAAVGGGMYCRDSSPLLTDVTFFGNYAGTGGGMSCEGGAPVLAGVTFLQNLCEAGPGALEMRYDCRGEITNTTFIANVGVNGVGALYCSNSSPSVANSTFAENAGSWAGAVELTGDSAPVFSRCTLYGNAGDAAGGFVCNEGSSLVIERTIIAGSTRGRALYPDCPSVTLACSDIFSNVGGDWTGCAAAQNGTNGNFSADPLFCNPSSGDFSLQTCSPCQPGYHPNSYDCGGVIGAFGEGCECGMQTESSTWGAIKTLYK